MAGEDTALFMLHEALHDLHGLSCVFRGEDNEASFDLVHAARAHIDKAIAALESEPECPPCACRGEEPIAVVKGAWLDSVAGLRPYLFLSDKGCFGINADSGPFPKKARPVRIIILEEKS